MKSLKNYVQEGKELGIVFVYLVLLLLFVVRLFPLSLSWNLKQVIMKDEFMRELSRSGVGEIGAISMSLRR